LLGICDAIKRIFAPLVSAQNRKTKCKFARPRLGAIFTQNRLLSS